ncbi:MAG: hypothetical protein HW420_434 [Candidatus Nitrosotenuis sp.]|nr:hypothetical protein [Candidatus Nitrosotenuis sp.]
MIALPRKQDHQSLIKGLIDHFVSSGFQIQYANYEGFDKPFVITRHAPDVIAVNPKNQLGCIGKVKLCSELVEQATKEQFTDFSKILMKSGKSQGSKLPFFIGVPQECYSKIKQTYHDFDISWRENIQVLGF